VQLKNNKMDEIFDAYSLDEDSLLQLVIERINKSAQ
jgi:hypothetical protein